MAAAAELAARYEDASDSGDDAGGVPHAPQAGGPAASSPGVDAAGAGGAAAPPAQLAGGRAAASPGVDAHGVDADAYSEEEEEEEEDDDDMAAALAWDFREGAHGRMLASPRVRLLPRWQDTCALPCLPAPACGRSLTPVAPAARATLVVRL
jgi:hypothetical protein